MLAIAHEPNYCETCCRRTLNRSAVVVIGVDRCGVGRDNGAR